MVRYSVKTASPTVNSFVDCTKELPSIRDNIVFVALNCINTLTQTMLYTQLYKDVLPIGASDISKRLYGSERENRRLCGSSGSF